MINGEKTDEDDDADAPDSDKPDAKNRKYKKGGKVHGKMPKQRLDKKSRGGKTKDFHPGGEKGKLHRELGIPEGEKIGTARVAKATHSDNPEIRRDAIRAKTMSKWHKG